MQHDNDPNISENLQEKKKKSIQMLQWPSQSKDLNPTEALWPERERAAHKQISTNIDKPKECGEEDSAKIPAKM